MTASPARANRVYVGVSRLDADWVAACLSEAGVQALRAWSPTVSSEAVFVRARDHGRAHIVIDRLRRHLEPESLARCAALLSHFEDRDGLYVEKGLLHVRIGGIVVDFSRRFVRTYVEELPQLSLPPAPHFLAAGEGVRPLRWRIGAGLFSRASTHIWQAGYGAWVLLTEPSKVRETLRLAAELDPALGPTRRYHLLAKGITVAPLSDPPRTLFPLAEARR